MKRFVLGSTLLAVMTAMVTPALAESYRDIHNDRTRLQHERQERNAAARAEARALAHGKLRVAAKLDAKRRHEQAEVRAVKRDIRHDRVELRRDHYVR